MGLKFITNLPTMWEVINIIELSFLGLKRLFFCSNQIKFQN